MLGYAPIDEEPVFLRNQPILKKPVAKVNENTECNYLVMFFILGVFMLVISDQLK